MAPKKKSKVDDTKRDIFFQSITKAEFEIVSKLQNILSNYGSLEERISYSVLYYFQRSRVCFIWPSSIKPGPKSGVQFGFCNGYLLKDEKGILERENRKQVYCLTYHSLDEIQESELHALVQNALAVDETMYPSKKQSR